MKIIYACGFSLKSGEGKGRATAQKIMALGDLVERLDVLSIPSEKKLLKLMLLPFLEIFIVIKIVLIRPNVLISRGFSGCIAQYIAGKIGILTVREVHADILGELKLIPHRGVDLYIIGILSKLANYADRKSDIRIFNHPTLMSWYEKNYKLGSFDGCVYNGFNPDSKSALSKSSARKLFGFKENAKILAFTGAASEWHGVQYLVNLQKEFIRNNDNIIIVCGGGKIRQELDVDSILLNITPLDDVGCANLIRSCDICLLPVKPNRVSPGSPLKLYDYILNERWVAAQSNVLGYSDEVVNHGAGICVDFQNSISTRKDIVEFLAVKGSESNPNFVDLSWRFRMNEWLVIIKRAIEGKS